MKNYDTKLNPHQGERPAEELKGFKDKVTKAGTLCQQEPAHSQSETSQFLHSVYWGRSKSSGPSSSSPETDNTYLTHMIQQLATRAACVRPATLITIMQHQNSNCLQLPGTES